MKVNKKEILRYLGYGKNIADETVNNIIDECLKDLKNYSDMKSIYKYFPLEIKDENIKLGNICVKSQNLKKNLLGCNEVVIFAATLGARVDLLIKRYSKMAMSRAVILQAAATAYIEEYCDLCQNKIIAENEKRNLFIRPRFSPGYGDFSIEHQKDIISILDCPRKIGLTLTDSLILVPSKSVTAVMGVSPISQKCHIKGCEECSKFDCNFRRS